MDGQDSDIPVADDADASGDQGSAPIAPLLPRHIHRGWWIVLAGAVLWGLAGFGESYASLDLLWLVELDGWSKSLAMASVGIFAFLVLLPGRPLFGMLADRYGPRVILLPILMLIVLSIGVLSVAGGPWPLAVLATFVLVLVMAVLPITLAVATVNVFRQNYGIALAVLLTGPALAQLIPTFIFDVPVLGHAMFRAILVDEWSSTFLSLGDLLVATALLIGTGLMALVLWRRPRDQSIEATVSSPTGNEARKAGGTRDVLKSRSYVFFVGALVLQVIGVSTLLSAVSGISPNLRMFLPLVVLGDPSAIFPLLSIAGLLATGWLSDRYERRSVVVWILVAQILAAPVMVLYAEEGGVLLLAIAFGIGFGANGAANLALQVELWSNLNFGLLMGVHMSIAALLSAVLTPIGLWFIYKEIPTSVSLPLAIIPLAIALILILLMKRPQPQAPGTVEIEPQAVSL